MSHYRHSLASQSGAYKIKKSPCGCKVPSCNYSNYPKSQHDYYYPASECKPRSSSSSSSSYHKSEARIECPDSIPSEIAERAKAALLKSNPKDIFARKCMYQVVDVPVEVKKKFKVRLKVPVQVDLYQPKVVKKRCQEQE